MRSGIVYGTAGMLDGIIDRIRDEFPDQEVSVVATGGNAPVIVRYCRNPHCLRQIPADGGALGHLPEKTAEKSLAGTAPARDFFRPGETFSGGFGVDR